MNAQYLLQMIKLKLVDPLMLKKGLAIIRALYQSLYDKAVNKFWFEVLFPEDFMIITEDFKVTSRLENAGINIMPERGHVLKYNNICFLLRKHEELKRPCLRVIASTDIEDDLPLFELIEILIDKGVIVPRS